MVLGTIQVLAPVFKSFNDCEHFLIRSSIISLGWVELERPKGYWVPLCLARIVGI